MQRMRIGFYTGRLYLDSDNIEDIQECCLTYPVGHFKSEEELMNKKQELHRRCLGCFGCEESRKRM